MANTTQPRVSSSLVFIFFFLVHVFADCECGYTSVINNTLYTFTDLLETDFLHLADVSVDTDWIRQGYNVTSEVSRGPYGTAFEVDNIASNPVANNHSYTGAGIVGGDLGLQLFVRGGVPTDGLVPTAEIDSYRTDMLFGSYRAAMKLTGVPGTCGAFFWYFNDSQEIDMEFLSSQFNATSKTYPVNLVMQSSQSAAAGFQTAGKNYIVANLPFDPTTGYHEYRIDFVPGSAIFYADGQILGIMNSSLPSSPGHLILTHWSNGNPGWTYGPPVSDAVLAVSYIKAYFNSSLATRESDFATRCTHPLAANATCPIPNQTAAPDPDRPDGNVTANTFFFIDHGNSTVNQTVYLQGLAAGGIRQSYFVLIYVVVIIFVLVTIETFGVVHWA